MGAEQITLERNVTRKLARAAEGWFDTWTGEEFEYMATRQRRQAYFTIPAKEWRYNAAFLMPETLDLANFTNLPEDAKVVRVWADDAQARVFVLFQSKELNVLEEGEEYPEYTAKGKVKVRG